MQRHLLTVVALVACKGNPEPQAAPTPTPVGPGSVGTAAGSGSAAAGSAVADDAACEARAKKFGDRLAALAKSSPGIPLSKFPDKFELPTSTAGKPIEQGGVTVTVTADDKVFTFGGPGVPLAEGARLIDEHYYRNSFEAEVMEKGPKRPWPLYVYADKRAKLASLAKLFGDELFLADKSPRHPAPFTIRLLVTGDAKVDPYDAALLAKDSVKKVVAGMPKTIDEIDIYRAKAMRDAGDPCPTIPMVYAEGSIGSPIDQIARQAENFPKALVECRCNNSDADLWEWGVLAIFGAYQPTPKWVELPKLDAKDKRTVGDVVK